MHVMAQKMLVSSFTLIGQTKTTFTEHSKFSGRSWMDINSLVRVMLDDNTIAIVAYHLEIWLQIPVCPVFWGDSDNSAVCGL